MQRSSKTIGNVVATSAKTQGQRVSPEKSPVATIRCAEASTGLSKPMLEAEASARFGGFRPMPIICASAMSSLSKRVGNIIVRFVALVIKRFRRIRLVSIRQSPLAGGYEPIYFRQVVTPLSPSVPESQNCNTKPIRKTLITSRQIEVSHGKALESTRPKTQVGKEQSHALRLPRRSI
jgi:hypothetical protein